MNSRQRLQSPPARARRESAPADFAVGRRGFNRQASIVFLCTWLLVWLTQCRPPAADPSLTLLPTSSPTATPRIGVTLVTRAAPTAVFSQLTPTPLPTATATPTATPIVYQVEEGDTLLGIAIERYTTVEEIKALNPGVVPELLQIGQALVLPPPATAVFQGAVATLIPLQVEVSSVSLYQTPVGSLWVLGEVWNRGSLAAENVQVQISLSDGGGGPPLTVTTWVEPGVIPAGAKAPFGVLMSQPPAAYDQPSLAIVGGATVVDLGSRYLDLAVTELDMTVEESQVVLSGIVQNVGERPAGAVILVATLYNEQGSVVGYGLLWLAEPLAAGEERPFTLQVAPPGGRAAGFAVVAQGVAQK